MAAMVAQAEVAGAVAARHDCVKTMAGAGVTRDELIRSPTWREAHDHYYGAITFANSGERVERYGADTHRLHERLPNIQIFWRCHIAPATNRPTDQWLVPHVDPAIARMAERSYEVFCAFVDALDQLVEIRSGPLYPPRYRPCLNVLRHAGDAMQLFTSLRNAIEAEGREIEVVNGVKIGLSTSLGASIEIFPDFKQAWARPYQNAIRCRNMLVHEGRPWFYFDGPDFETMPHKTVCSAIRANATGSSACPRRARRWSTIVWRGSIGRMAASSRSSTRS